MTLGICYERNGKFAGGAYNPVVRRLEKAFTLPATAGAEKAIQALDGKDFGGRALRVNEAQPRESRGGGGFGGGGGGGGRGGYGGGGGGNGGNSGY